MPKKSKIIGQVVAPDESGGEVVLATLFDDGRWETTNPVIAVVLTTPPFDDPLKTVTEFWPGQLVLQELADWWGNGAHVVLGEEPTPLAAVRTSFVPFYTLRTYRTSREVRSDSSQVGCSIQSRLPSGSVPATP
jgi:hypothetical protein